MTWNYRIFWHENKYAGVTHISYALHEVFYNDSGKPCTYALEPEIVADSIEDMIASLTMMLKDAKDCGKGVKKKKKIKILSEEDFNKGGCYYSFMVAEEKEWMEEAKEALPLPPITDAKRKYNVPNAKKRSTKKVR